jgi:hypothetical protein
MNELKQRRIQKQYQDYYALYNKVVRPVQEKQDIHTVQGLASWSESSVSTTQQLRVVK